MSYLVLHNLKINKNTGAISAQLIDMGVKKKYRGNPIEYKDFYQDECEVKLTSEQKMASFIHDLLVGEYYVDDFNSKYFRLNYANRKVSGREDIDFIDNYGIEYTQIIKEELKSQNINRRLKENEYCDLLIKLNKKYEKEINNIFENKTVTGRPLKDWEIKEQKKNLKSIFENMFSSIETIESQEEQFE